jgi:hypothetical protein
MTTINIFSVRLGRLLLTCQRDTTNSYVLISDGFRAPMTVDMAAELGGAAERIRRRAKKAVDGRMKPGPIFSVQLPDTKVTIGVTDDGCDLYCEAGDEHVRLSEDEQQALLFSLGRLAADVASLAQNQWGGEPHQGNVVPGMREALDRRLPPWAREFE